MLTGRKRNRFPLSVKHLLISSLLLCAWAPNPLLVPKAWAAPAVKPAERSTAWLCQSDPDRVDRLFDRLDLTRKGLEQVSAAVKRGNRVAACDALIAYYKAQAEARGFETSGRRSRESDHRAADRILNNTFTFQSVTGIVPRKADGSRDWTYRGPNDDREWAYFLNRQGYLYTLLRAYRDTGDKTYVQCLDQILHEWVRVNPYPGRKTGQPQWRGLETHSRVDVWSRIFYDLRSDDELSPATRILMLSAIPDHADYLSRYHAGGGNWITMELSSLARAALYWPEFKNADRWMDTATDHLTPEIVRQVYPDGAQKELSTSYHWVALRSFEAFAGLVRKAHKTLPPKFETGLENMYAYAAYALRPDGYGPLNNDSDLQNYRRQIQRGAQIYNRPDWTWIITNGAEGKAPAGPPSRIFPWAGQLVMRSGWNKNAQWAFFDAGPWGIGHQHSDKLHLSVSAYGRDLLVDSGRMYYKPDQWRHFFTGASAHNTLLIDGHGQNPEEKAVTRPLAQNAYEIAPAFDFARGVFAKGYRNAEGPVTHTRAIFYLRGKFWIVADRVETDRPRQVQALWHYHPDCTLSAEGQTVCSTDAGKGNLKIVPVSDQTWTVKIVKGQTDPEIQGWWSERYNSRVPNPVAVYTADIVKTTTFAWVLVPANGPVPDVRAAMSHTDENGITVRVTVGAESPVLVHVPIKAGAPSVE